MNQWPPSAMRPMFRWPVWCWMVWLGVMVGGMAIHTVPAARGQENAAPASPSDGGNATGGATGATPGAGNTGPAAEPTQKSYLELAYSALGPMYSFIFLMISFVFVALLVMNILAARNICPQELADGFRVHLDEERYQDAYDLAKSDDSFLGQVLAAGMEKVSSDSYPQAVSAMQEVGEEETMKLDHRLGYLALIGQISPMIGLFGTVDGMIRSFLVIADSATTPAPAELAKGIYTALYTTLVGLAIAIPAIASYGIVRNYVNRFILRAGFLSESLMSRFKDGQPKKAR